MTRAPALSRYGLAPDEALLVSAAKSLLMAARLIGARISVQQASPEFLAALAALPGASSRHVSHDGSEWDQVDVGDVLAYSEHRRIGEAPL